MKIPQKIKKLQTFTDELIHDCAVSRATRVTQYMYWMNYYYSGSSDQYPAIYNRCYPHVDRLASFLFSPVDIRYTIEFADTAGKEWLTRAAAAGKFLTKETKRTKCNLAFSQAVDYALPKGKCFLKLAWTDDGLKPFLIQPESFGVFREDISSLEDQEAFTLSSWHHPEQMRRQLQDHPDKDSIMKKIDSAMSSDTDETRPGNMVHQIIMGGISPVPTAPPSTVQRGMVNVTGGPIPQLSPEVARTLVRRDELWVWDDAREDWTTIVSVGGSGSDAGIIIEGKYKHRNLCGLKGENPFIEICANPVDDYFWGRSELAMLQPLQDTLNTRVMDANRLLSIRSDPPMSYSGMSGLTREKHRAFRAPGGYMADVNPNAKAQPVAPEMPPDLLQQIDAVLKYMDDVGGFSDIMQGAGESGVRAGVHAQTLVRTGGSRLRDRALLIESQCEDMGDFAFKLLQAKDATVFNSGTDGDGDGQEDKFLLSQIPDDYRVTVDSHSASPAFSEDARNLAFALAKAGAINGEGLLTLTQPPLTDMLIAQWRDAQKAKAAQEAQNPQPAKPGPKRKTS